MVIVVLTFVIRVSFSFFVLALAFFGLALQLVKLMFVICVLSLFSCFCCYFCVVIVFFVSLVCFIFTLAVFGLAPWLVELMSVICVLLLFLCWYCYFCVAIVDCVSFVICNPHSCALLPCAPICRTDFVQIQQNQRKIILCQTQNNNNNAKSAPTCRADFVLSLSMCVDIVVYVSWLFFLMGTVALYRICSTSFR